MAAGEYVTTSAAELAERIDAAAHRFAGLASEVGPDRVVGTWTSAEVVAHLVTVVNRYNEFDPSRLAAAPRGVDEINRRELEALTAAPMGSLLSELDAGMEQFRDRWGPAQGIALDAPFPFHGGATIDFQSGMTNLVGEFLVHGWDVAHAVGREWAIDERDGALLFAFGTQILPAYLRPSNPWTLGLRFDLDGVAPLVFDVAGPTLVVRAPRPDDDPDVVFAGPAAAAVLWFYARVPVDEPDATALQVVGGRRPELVSVITELFEEP